MYGSNFFNPYMYQTGGSGILNAANKINTVGRMGASKGLFSNLFKNFSLSGFLSGTSKTLNVINQAIPIYYQVKPMISNAKTMFRVMNAVKSSDSNNEKSKNYDIKTSDQNGIKHSSNNESPTFFI